MLSDAGSTILVHYPVMYTQRVHAEIVYTEPEAAAHAYGLSAMARKRASECRRTRDVKRPKNMLHDDGDLVRGLGFVTMYSAWVEEDVDDLLRMLRPVEPFDEKRQRWPISRKLTHAAQVIRTLPAEDLRRLPEALEFGVNLFERRNEAIHGRIFSGHDRVDYLQSGRPNKPTRPVQSSELYQLANDFWDYRGNLTGPQFFRLPRAIAEFIRGAS